MVIELVVAGIGAASIFALARYQRVKAAEDNCNRLLFAASGALQELVTYTEYVEAGHIQEYASVLPRLRAIAGELLIASLPLSNKTAITETANQLVWAASFIPEPWTAYDVASPVRAQLHRTYPELFEEWGDNVWRAIDSIQQSVMLHNGGKPVPGIVASPPRAVAALQARKRGLPPPDFSAQVRVVSGNVEARGTDGTRDAAASRPDEPTGTGEP